MRTRLLLVALGSTIVLACGNTGPGRDQQRAAGGPNSPPVNTPGDGGDDPYEEDEPGEGPSGDPVGTPPANDAGAADSADGGAATDSGLSSSDGGAAPSAFCSDSVRVVADGLFVPQDLAVDSTHVYLTEGVGSTPGRILKVGKGDGTITVLQNDRTRPGSIRVEGAFVYWNEERASTWFIYRASTAGGDAPQLLADDAGSGKFAVDSLHVYYGAAASGGLKSVPKAGGPKTTLTSASPFRIAVDATHVYYNRRSATAETRVERIAKTGGPSTTLATIEGGGDMGYEASGDVLVDSERAYWIVSSGFGDPPSADVRLMSVPKSGGESTLVSTLPIATGWLEMRDGNFFFTNTDADDIRRLPRTGGASTVLGAFPKTQATIALDEGCAYWLSQSPTHTASKLVTVRR